MEWVRQQVEFEQPAQEYVRQDYLHSGDLGYDTGIYNEDFPRHVSEGNYLIVLKRIHGEWKITAHAAIPNPRMK